MKSTAGPFLLGRCVFQVRSERPDLLQAITELFPACRGDDSGGIAGGVRGPLLEVDVDDLLAGAENLSGLTGQELAIAAVSLVASRCQSWHDRCFWLDAAVLLAPDGRLFLLAGPSFAGKTTLTLAMVLSRGWKALAEDIAVLDMDERSVIPFERPFSVRPGCAELLERCAGVRPGPLVLGTWCPGAGLFHRQAVPARFAVCIRLVPLNAVAPDARMSPEEISPDEFVRFVLPLSSALRVPGAIDVLKEGVADARCCLLSGGSLPERVQLLLSM